MLVLMEASTGHIINNNAHTQLLGDPEGTKFPWRQVPIRELLHAPLKKQESIVMGCDVLQDKLYILFFSAKWVCLNITLCYIT